MTNDIKSSGSNGKMSESAADRHIKSWASWYHCGREDSKTVRAQTQTQKDAHVTLGLLTS